MLNTASHNSAEIDRLAANAAERDGSLAVPHVLPRIGPLSVDGKYFASAGQRLQLKGVTYGPFPPSGEHGPFPPAGRICQDLQCMSELGVNSLRTYHVPPVSFLETVSQHGTIGLMVDVPWAKHLCFLDSATARRGAREAVRFAAIRGAKYDCVWGYSVANEIPPDVIRWHGARRVQRFLSELADVARQAHPAGLVTYANYPPTEYLDLPFLDFAMFNVYLHDREVFRRYLFRLQNLVGVLPLVLGELGMDTIRHGELAQARFLRGHIQEAKAVGLAGSFIFSWTDEWHTGGSTISNWAFGVTDAERKPKLAFDALKRTFSQTPADLLVAPVRASVVVCTYNGARTIAQCLQSLQRLRYPDYEVIVVDDGSTDDTPNIIAEYPFVRVISQQNEGLSAARNAGLRAATGEIVAYTDDDCFVDPDWLTMMIAQLEHARLEDSRVAGLGGPNLTPDDGPTAAAVSAAPGQPTHILESDQVAEHIPGCNMAFWRESLLSVNGFDPQYRAAGDDVDICWRLQSAGMWLTFSPSAFVWHHRRATPKAYLKQQAGYGKAEALLRFQHPDRFTDRGHGKWRGMLYGACFQGITLEPPVIYRGTFCTAPFQCIYRAGPAHWAMIPTTLEWHLLAGLVATAGLIHGSMLCTALTMWCLSLVLAGLQAVQAQVARKYDSPKVRATVAALCYLQPLVRSWARYQTRYFSGQLHSPPLPDANVDFKAVAKESASEVEYWGTGCPERTDLLQAAMQKIGHLKWGYAIDTGWSERDLEVFVDPWTRVEVRTVQEELGGGKRVVRARFQIGFSRLTKFAAFLSVVFIFWRATVEPVGALAAAGCLAIAGLWLWKRGRKLRATLISVFNEQAVRMGLIPCGDAPAAAKPHGATSQPE